MKKLLFWLFLGSMVYVTFFTDFLEEYIFVKEYKPLVEEEVANFDLYYIFGTRLNFEGSLTLNEINVSDDFYFVLNQEENEIVFEFEELDINDNKVDFKLNKLNNEGIYLDDLEIGKYFALIKRVSGEEVYYYTIKNNSEYDDLTYYTLTRNNTNNKIDISFSEEFLNFEINNSLQPTEYYDVVLDPGHGGIDSGAVCYDNSCTEKELNLEIAYLLKTKLESLGLKVAVTRPEEDDDNVLYDTYGEEGRVVIPNKLHSKLFLSIHANSLSESLIHGGVEVYTALNMDLTFASLLASNIKESAGGYYSPKNSYKVLDGVYIRTFEESTVESTQKDLIDQGIEPYPNVTTETTYYSLIREVGSFLTGVYVDGRNPDYYTNFYYNSNLVAEPFLLELGYLNDSFDVKNLKNNKNSYVDGIADAIVEFWSLQN